MSGLDIALLVGRMSPDLLRLLNEGFKSFKARDRTQVSPDDRSRVASVVRLTSLSDAALIAAVAADRADGSSWADVGSTLGITRSAAHGRFSQAVELLEQEVAAKTGSAPTALELAAITERTWADIEELAKQEQETALARVIAADPRLLSAVLEKVRSDERAKLNDRIDELTALIDERLGKHGQAAHSNREDAEPHE